MLRKSAKHYVLTALGGSQTEETTAGQQAESLHQVIIFGHLEINCSN